MFKILIVTHSVVYSRRFDRVILTSRFSLFRVTWPRGPPGTRQKCCHMNRLSSPRQDKHCCSEDSRLWLGWAQISQMGESLFQLYCLNWYSAMVCNGQRHLTNHLLFSRPGLLPPVPDQCFVPFLWPSSFSKLKSSKILENIPDWLKECGALGGQNLVWNAK